MKRKTDSHKFPFLDFHPLAHVVQKSEIYIPALSLSIMSSTVLQTNFPKRPGFGSKGKQITVSANHFPVKLRSDADCFHYDIAIIKQGDKIADDMDLSKAVRELVIKGCLKQYPAAFNNLPVVTDNRKNLYSPTRLPFPSKTFDDIVCADQSVDDPKAKKFTVTIKCSENSAVRIAQLTALFEGKINYTPYDAIQVLDIALRNTAAQRYSVVGRNFFSPDGAKSIGEGAELWFGYHQSLRPTQSGLTLNIDTANTAFISEMSVVDYIDEVLGKRGLPSTFNRAQFVNVSKALKGIKVNVTHRQGNRKFRIVGLSRESAAETFFTKEDGSKESVANYFKSTYQALRYPNLPCLQVGPHQRPISLPLEVCHIFGGQKMPRKVTDKQVVSVIKFACQKPDVRKSTIDQSVARSQFQQDGFAKAFGVEVDPRMMQVKARVLPEPDVIYGQNKVEKPRDGSWNMKDKKFFMPKAFKAWAVINFCDPRRCQESDVAKFAEAVIRECPKVGMGCPRNTPPIIQASSFKRGTPTEKIYEEALKQCFQQFKSKPEFILCVKPDQGAGLYGEIKRASDSFFGIVSQCMLSKHIQKCSPQYIANILLKVNAKLGGKNAIIGGKLPKFSDCPTIIFGADVTHPSPMDTSRPSIAALAGSMDQYGAYHAGSIRKQGHRVEQIEDLQGMTIELLKQFYRATKTKPAKIIFYRDGVSEGQFQMVLDYEISALRRACEQLEVGYKPSITFIIVQKRHHTRFFPIGRNDADRSGNVKAGTVIETGVCHPTEFDFYLMSHGGLQGTSRPTHYHVLLDENRFTPDELQELSFKLCHIYVRCTKSVSIVPACYYAHLIAFRARFYLDEGSETGSMVSSSSASAATMKEVHRDLSNLMYFA